MVNCSKCGKKIGLFQAKYDYKDEDGNPIKYCSKCNEDSEKQKNKRNNEENISFDSGMRNRFEYLIQKFQNEDKNIKHPKDPERYNGDNCWVCSSKVAVKDYNGFKKICEDCKFLVDNWDTKTLHGHTENFSGLKRQKREFLIQEQEKLIRDREIRLKKEEQEKERFKEKNAPLISDYCEKYLSNKDLDFKSVILAIYANKEIFESVKGDNLDLLQDHFIRLYQETQEESNDYDDIMSTETTCNNALQLIQDAIKLKKILDKKDIQTDYIQIIEEMAKLINLEMKNLAEKLAFPAYKRISKITTDKKQIIKEYLKLGFHVDVIIIESLFDKFGLSYTHKEINQLLGDCIQEKELEDFERNLGLSNFKQMGDFETLNGHQFEGYLKDLFSILGYQVMRTKLSGDQGADLIIKKDDDKTVVQAKKYSGAVTNKAIQEVVASKNHYGCNNAIVVTTGVFTKSAIELAKSNKVELWDKNKLKKVINEINNSINKKSNYKMEQSVSLENDLFPFVCPFCSSKIKVNITDLPKRNKSKEMTCPECSMTISMQIPEKSYICSGCKQEFDIFKYRVEHTKTCKKIKERQFKCSSCDKEFTLDDSEFKELKTTGKINVKCPTCSKSNTLKQ